MKIKEENMTGNIAQGDIPFAIIALTATKAALEKNK